MCDCYKLHRVIVPGDSSSVPSLNYSSLVIFLYLCSGKNMERTDVLRIWKFMSKHSVLVMGTTVIFRHPHMKKSLENVIKT